MVMTDKNGTVSVLEAPELQQSPEPRKPFTRPTKPELVTPGDKWVFEGEFVMIDFIELAEFDKLETLPKMYAIGEMMSRFLVEWTHPYDPRNKDSWLWLRPAEYQDAQKRFLEWANGTFQA